MEEGMKQLFVWALILFFIAGILVGYFVGGYSQQVKWKEYNEEQEEYYNAYCSSSDSMVGYFPTFNINTQ